jgi:hypothetical protein
VAAKEVYGRPFATAPDGGHGVAEDRWLPASIAGRLPYDYRDDQAVRVSHEAIYQWIYAQPVSTLARELIRLRTGRPARRSGPRPVPAPRIREPRYLDERPAEGEDRKVPGHWEGDLVNGKGGKSAAATLVERTSRFVVLVPLSGRDALTVGDAVIAAVGGANRQRARLRPPVRDATRGDVGPAIISEVDHLSARRPLATVRNNATTPPASQPPPRPTPARAAPPRSCPCAL